jgi:hypothetical protein
MAGDRMRRRLLSFLAPAVLAVVLAAPSSATRGHGFSMQLGSTFTITGRTGSVQGTHARATGTVVLSGRWGVGPWHVITTAATDRTGNYRFTVKPNRRGNLTLRITPPDHHPRRYLLRVY